MNVNDIFQQGNNYTIDNPKYKKGSRKEPKTIQTDNFFKTPLNSTSDLPTVQTAFNATGISNEIYGDMSAYTRYGISPNRIHDLDAQRAEAQSNLTKYGNAMAQTLVSEIGLGILKASTDIVGGIFNIGSDEYSNPVSDKIQEWKDYFDQEVAPIYADPNVDILHGGLTNWGWYMSNLPSVASSLTLLIPSTYITKLLSMGAKAAALSKIGTVTRNGIKSLAGINKIRKAAQEAEEIGKAAKGLNTFQKGIDALVDLPAGESSRLGTFFSNTTNALLQRTMENYQEAQGVQKDTYDNAYETLMGMKDKEYAAFLTKNKDLADEVDNPNDRDAVAKKIAKRAADEDFKINFANITFDVIQMYGLRNFWKGLKSGENSYKLSSAVNKAKQEVANMNKTPEQIKAAEAAVNKWKERAKNIGRRLTSEKVIIAGELSEGVEEAVNYIAQEEGMYVGKHLLNQEPASSFDNRLSKYIASGQLWDSAFWGVLGGVVFHHLGSGFGRVQQTIEDRQNKKVNSKTGEGKKVSPWSLSEKGEIKTRRDDINNWATQTKLFIDRKNKIAKGENPYATGENDKTLTPDEQIAASQKATHDFIDNIVLNAAHKGNYDYLEEFIKSDEVRKAMVDNGVVDSEANSKQVQQELLDRMKSTINTYQEELARLIDLNDKAQLTRKDNERVPIEFLQSIADTNTKYKNQQKIIKDNMSRLDNLIEESMQDEEVQKILGSEFTTDQYRAAASKSIIANTMGELYAERKRLLTDPKFKNNISAKVGIDTINRQLKEYQEMLNEDDLRLVTAVMINNTMNDKREVFRERTAIGEVFDNLLSGKNEKGETIKDDEIIEGLKKFAEDNNLDERLAKFENTENIASQINARVENAKILNKRLVEADKIGSKNGSITKLLVGRSNAELQYRYLNGQIIKDTKTFNQEVSFINNTLNDARKEAIDNSYKTINELASKYDRTDSRVIKNAVGAYYNDDTEGFNEVTSELTDAERNSLREALDVLDLSNNLNNRLGVQVQEMLDINKRIEEARNKSKDNEENPNSEQPAEDKSEDEAAEEAETSDESKGEQPTGEKPQEATESPKSAETNNSPQATKQAGTEPKTESQTNQQKQKPTQNKSKIDMSKPISIDFVKGKVSNVDSDVSFKVEKIATTTNRYTLQPNSPKVITDDLYDGVENILQDGSKVTKLPIIQLADDGTFEVISKGEVAVPGSKDDQDTTQAQQAEEETKQNEGQEEDNKQTSSTGGLQPQATPTPSTPASSPTEQKSKPVVDLSIPKDAEDIAAIRQGLISTAINAVKANRNITIEELEQVLKDAMSKTNYDEDVIKNAVQFVLVPFKRKLKSNDSKASAVADVIISSSSTVVNGVFQIGANFAESVNNLVREYADNSQIKPVNNKYYVKLEDVLRWAEKVIPSNGEYNNFIFDAVKAYLTSDSAKNDIVLIDDSELGRIDFLARANKSFIKPINTAGEDITRSIDTNLGEIISDPNDIKHSEDELKNLKLNDEITFELSQKPGKNTKVLLAKHNGITVGYIGMPDMDVHGRWKINRDGWNYVISKSDENNDGDFKDWLKSIANKDTPEFESLNNIIYKAAFEEITKDDVKAFQNHPLIKEAIREGYLSVDNNRITYKRALEGLGKLWQYNADLAKDGDVVSSSFDEWYDKLRSQCNQVLDLVNKPDITYLINTINSGEIIRATDRNETDSEGNVYATEKVAIPIQSALSPNVSARISVGTGGGSVISSGRSSTSSYSSKNGQTYMTIENQNGTIDYIQAFPLHYAQGSYIRKGKEVSIPRSQMFDKLVDTVVEQLVAKIENVQSPEDWNELRNFINTAFNVSNQGLFNGITFGQDNSGTYYINYGYKVGFTFYRKGTNGTPIPDLIPFVEKQGGKAVNYKFNEVGDKLRQIIKDNIRFNINRTLIESDNNSNILIHNSFINVEKGKFSIDIPAYKNIPGFHTNAESYNDFIISNNLVRVNLDQENSSNYRDKGIRKQFNAGFGITALSNRVDTNETSTPVEEYNQPSNKSSRFESTKKLVQDITKSDSETQGLDIVKSLVTKEVADIIEKNKKSVLLNEVFPAKVTYDDKALKESNEEAVAINKGKSHEIIIGDEFIDIATDANKGGGNRAARILIHERLHTKLSTNQGKKIKRNLQSVYDDFFRESELDLVDIESGNLAAVNERRGYNLNNKTADELKKFLTDLRYSDISDSEIKLEEFVVESLTSSALASYMNHVKVEGEEVGKAKTLWQRIMQFISKLFNFDIADNSLRAKEFNILGEVFKKAKTDTTSNSSNSTTSTTNTPVEGDSTNEQSTTETENETTETEEQSVQVSEEDEDDDDDNYNDLNTYNKKSIEDDDEDMFSVIREYPSLTAALEDVPLQERAIATSRIASGELEIVCR
jgi:hypothetical protein